MKKILILMMVMMAWGCGVAVGQTAYVTGGYNSVAVINVATNTVTGTISVGVDPEGVSVSQDGNRVYVSNYISNSVSVINTHTHSVLATIPVGLHPGGICVTPNGTRVYVSNSDDNSVSVINTSNNTVLTTISVGSISDFLCVNPSGTKVYVPNHFGNTISVINTATNTVTTIIPVGNNTDPFQICISPDGSRLYVTNEATNNVGVIDAVTNTVINIIPVGSSPLGITITPDGSKVYVANNSSYSVSVINTSTNTVGATIPVGSGPTGISVSTDGSKIYVANNGGHSVSVINTTADTVSFTIPISIYPSSVGNFISNYPPPCALLSPTVTPSGSTTFCQGDSITLTSSQAPFYLWNNSSTAQSITVHTSGNYSVTITDSNGCTASSSPVLVIVHDLPTPIITVTGSLALCQGDSVILTASHDSLYLWNNGSTTDSITVNTTGNYSVTVTDSNGCRGISGATNVTVYPMPHAAFTTNDTIGCQPFLVHFTNASSNATSYHWDFGDSQQSLNINPYHIFNLTGDYTVTLIATNDTSVCPSDTLIMTNHITVLPSPLSVITANGPLAFCFGDSVMLTSAIYTSYLWNTGATTQSIEADTSGDYTVTVTGSNGCTASQYTTTVYVYPLPTPNITASGPLSFCIGDSVTLTSSIDSLYLWNTGATTQSITTDTSGIYTVTITINSGCTGTNSVTVAVHNFPVPSITSSATIPICIGVNDTLTCIPAGASYHWNNGATTQSILVNNFGDFLVTLVDSNGCATTTSSIHITTNPLPVPTIASSGPIPFCPGVIDTLICNPAGASYLWNNGATTQSIIVDSTGVFFVALTDTNGCIGNSPFENVTLYTPLHPIITQHGDTLSIPNFPQMQWLKNGIPMAGDTNHLFIVTSNACYSVMVTDINGCTGISDTVCLSTGINELMANDGISIFPNPNHGVFTIQLEMRNEELGIRIANVIGQIIFEDNIQHSSGTTNHEINLNDVSGGVYFVEILIGDKTFNRKIVIGKF